MKIYISGAVTGIENYEHFFEDAVRKLSNEGYETLNPIHLCNSTWSWEQCMKVTLKAMLDCDAVAILENWEHSRGSNIEVQLAKELEIPIHSVENWVRLAHKK